MLRERDPIPSSDNLKELSEFWQTHDLTDYLDQMDEVQGPLLLKSCEQNDTQTTDDRSSS